MHLEPPPGRPVFVPHILGQVGADLTEVVRDKGRGCRNPLHLAEGVELHGTDEIQYHLHNLVRGLGRQTAQQKYDNGLKQSQQGIPADQVHMAEGLAEKLGYEGSGQVGADGKKQVGRPLPVS